MEHHFHTEVAEKYGVEEAVIIYNIAFWLKHNKANDKNYYDGYYWTFNSARAFEELFPYFNSKKISRLLNKLETLGAIKSGNYNKIAYDRTKWYTVTDEKLIELYKLSKDKNENCISQKCPMEKTEVENGLPKFEQPIPYNNTDNNTDNNHIRESILSLKKLLESQFNVAMTPTQVDKLVMLSKQYDVNPLEIYNKSDYLRGFVDKKPTWRMWTGNAETTFQNMKAGQYVRNFNDNSEKQEIKSPTRKKLS